MNTTAENEFRDYVAGRQVALFRTALLLTRNHQQAEDLLQAVLARVARYWARVNQADNVDAYVHRLMYHEQVRWWSRNRARTRERPTDQPPDRAAPGDLAASVTLRIRLHQALRELPTRQRTAVVLRYYRDLPEAEVAAIMGCSVGTVRSHTGRALAKLRLSCPDLRLPAGIPPAAGTTPGIPNDDTPPDSNPTSSNPPDSTLTHSTEVTL